jgi:hypothetical protein
MSQLSSPDLSAAAIPCHACGYDVRAQSPGGVCPECNASVAESIRLAPIPRRPAWRDSDPRWRRRMLAGVWLLLLLPLFATLRTLKLDARIPVPTFFKVQGPQSLDDSFIRMTYAYLIFCVGSVLFFSKERDRQPNRLDWTRRWGVIVSYCVFVFGIPVYAFITALVMLGIAALFMSMRLVDQPALTTLFVKLSTGYIYYGAHPSRLLEASLVVFSAVLVLLACAPLYDALRASGSKVVAAIFLSPLAFASLLQLFYATAYLSSAANASSPKAVRYQFYFDLDTLLRGFVFPGGSFSFDFLIESAKWCAIVLIVLWLSIAQLATLFRKQKVQ